MSLRPPLAAALAACAGLLAGCISTGGAEVVKAIPTDVATRGFVSEIEVRTTPMSVSADFKTVFSTRVSEKLKGCAKGDQPLKLVVDVNELKKANAAATLLIGSSNNIRGRAQLMRPGSAEVLADFSINRSVGGAGWATAIAMAQAEEQMSKAFGDEICRQAFSRR